MYIEHAHQLTTKGSIYCKLDFGHYNHAVVNQTLGLYELFIYKIHVNSMSSSMNETTALIAESHKLVESGNENGSKMLELILKIVTNTDKRGERMEQKMNEQIGELRKVL